MAARGCVPLQQPPLARQQRAVGGARRPFSEQIGEAAGGLNFKVFWFLVFASPVGVDLPMSSETDGEKKCYPFDKSHRDSLVAHIRTTRSSGEGARRVFVAVVTRWLMGKLDWIK